MQCKMYKTEMPTPISHKLLEKRHLEVFIEVEVTAGFCLGLSLGTGVLVLLLCASHDTSFLVIADTLLEEVGLSSKGDVLHEVEGVGNLVNLLVAESQKETVSNELNVLLHEGRVHAEKGARKSFSQELLLDLHGLSNDILDSLLAWAVLQVGEEKASKVGVETLVTGDELVGEGKTSHETTLL